nr:protein phosphatase 2C domain-containing protein [uncultured Cohaesibacter sp.]
MTDTYAPPEQTTRKSSAITHTGLVRKVNEDAILSRPELDLWAISDGMGGHVAGDFASQTVVQSLQSLADNLEPTEVMCKARQALHRAHCEIKAEAARRSIGTIGATAVILALSETNFLCLWVGDSRLYRYRDGAIEIISSDHSVVGELVEQGYLTWEEAENHPQSNQITRAVGVSDVLEIDKRRGEIRSGDRFLLCSDGLSKYANEDTLLHYLDEKPIDTVSDDLLQFALDAGAADNVSIIVVEV